MTSLRGLRVLYLLAILILFGSVGLQAAEAETHTATVANISWYKLTDVSQSNDPTYSVPNGAALISGFLNSQIQVNGQPVPGSFGSVKWAQTPSQRAEVRSCLNKALGAANLMETQALSNALGANPGGRATQLNVRVTGAINVNTGNTRVNPGDWTILEVSSFQTMVCSVSTFIP